MMSKIYLIKSHKNTGELSNKNISLLIPNNSKQINEESGNKKSNFTSNTTEDSLIRDLTNIRSETVFYEGFLIKITNLNKRKQLFFKLIGKDFYCKFYFLHRL